MKAATECRPPKFTLSSEQKMSTEEQSNRPRGGHTEKEIHMQTQMNQSPNALMVPCFGARRRPIDELLAAVRITDPVWWALFEDAHLSVVGSDLMDVLELIATAPGGPNGRLAGFVEGMYVNN